MYLLRLVKMFFKLLLSECLIFCFVGASISSWDYFTFTRQWPIAVCAMGVRENHTCEIPAIVQGWTIHGLWPSKSGTKGPTGCNNSWAFNASSLQPLIMELKSHWPNLFTDTATDSFWQHEWSKHGTCATSLTATNNEYKFFKMALLQNKKFNITEILNNQGIEVSSTASYMYNMTEAAIKREMNVNTVLQCAYDQGTKKQVFYELEICLDKKFNLIDCYPDERESNSGHYNIYRYFKKPQSTCPKKEPIFYPPLHPSFNNAIDVRVI